VERDGQKELPGVIGASWRWQERRKIGLISCDILWERLVAEILCRGDHGKYVERAHCVEESDHGKYVECDHGNDGSNGSNGSDQKKLLKEAIRANVTKAFESVHDRFLERIATRTSPIVEVGSAPNMDQSGTTATALLVTENMIIAATLGDSRAVMSSSAAATTTATRVSESSGSSSSSGSSGTQKKKMGASSYWKDFPFVSAIPFSIDHVASNPAERDLVIERGGFVTASAISGGGSSGMIPRVNSSLAVTRSIGDANLAPILSREPHVLTLDRTEIRDWCGDLGWSSSLPSSSSANVITSSSSEGEGIELVSGGPTIPCFVILGTFLFYFVTWSFLLLSCTSETGAFYRISG